jgi:hypothetical protein
MSTKKKLKPLKVIDILKMPGMSPTERRNCGLSRLNGEEVANLNEFLNRKRTRDLLAPGKPTE